MSVPHEHRQREARLRFDWGPTGAEAIADGAEIAVVVDVLSFTTAVTVAVERGIEVLPYRWRDASAASYAEAHDAILAVGRRQGLRTGGVSLSPVSLARADGVRRVVLPSPNGSAISFGLARRCPVVVAACLRNAAAVGAWLARRVADGAAVAVVAGGERWPDGSLRPALEDLWGAGAVLSALTDVDAGLWSPEARAASRAYAAAPRPIADELAATASGRELVASGFARDVDLAAEVDVTDVVPVLRDGAFAAG